MAGVDKAFKENRDIKTKSNIFCHTLLQNFIFILYMEANSEGVIL
jgi:hypothetical protein